jgi:segregation and condensation protein A
METTTYTIKLPQFEGPFDLLLFFIERDELDIYDIPISKITDDFLDYIRQMETMNIDLASEFILVAATLCRIKARLLLPRKQVDEEGNEIDPREELVQRLLEYKRYRSVLDEMRQLEETRSTRQNRGNVSKELRHIASVALVDVELENLSLFKLLKTFERLVSQMDGDKKVLIHSIIRYSYTIEDQQAYILSNLQKGKKKNFRELFSTLENRIHAIVTFLALLELLNAQQVTITQGTGTNNFWISYPRKGS